jgi:hypothetical protein
MTTDELAALQRWKERLIAQGPRFDEATPEADALRLVGLIDRAREIQPSRWLIIPTMVGADERTSWVVDTKEAADREGADRTVIPLYPDQLSFSAPIGNYFDINDGKEPCLPTPTDQGTTMPTEQQEEHSDAPWVTVPEDLSETSPFPEDGRFTMDAHFTVSLTAAKDIADMGAIGFKWPENTHPPFAAWFLPPAPFMNPVEGYDDWMCGFVLEGDMRQFNEYTSAQLQDLLRKAAGEYFKRHYELDVGLIYFFPTALQAAWDAEVKLGTLRPPDHKDPVMLGFLSRCHEFMVHERRTCDGQLDRYRASQRTVDLSKIEEAMNEIRDRVFATMALPAHLVTAGPMHPTQHARGMSSMYMHIDDLGYIPATTEKPHD